MRKGKYLNIYILMAANSGPRKKRSTVKPVFISETENPVTVRARFTSDLPTLKSRLAVRREEALCA